MQYDKTKFKEAVLYSAWRLLPDPAGGAIKLNKVLHYAELGHMREFNRPITGARYQKLPLGPGPRPLPPVRRELIEAGLAELRQDTFLGRKMDRLVPLEEPSTPHLSDEERRCIDQAVQLLANMNNTEASDFSHEEPGWQLVEIGEDIPYETAYLAPPVVTPAISRRVRELAAKYGVS